MKFKNIILCMLIGTTISHAKITLTKKEKSEEVRRYKKRNSKEGEKISFGERIGNWFKNTWAKAKESFSKTSGDTKSPKKGKHSRKKKECCGKGKKKNSKDDTN